MSRIAARRMPALHRRVDGGLLAVLGLGLLAVAPLVRPGYFASHDGMLHLYRFLGLDRAVQAGIFLPRWFPDFAFGYGQPVLNFYGPLAYYAGQVLRPLGLSLVAAAKASYALGTVAAGLGMYLWAKRALGGRPAPAAVAALAYLYAPYHLADLYVRGALAELWAMAWVPFFLWALTGLLVDRKPAYLVFSAGALAALILTHSLSLLVFGPLLLAYAALLTRQGGKESLRWAAGAVALALALSAFYWLPALTESRFVGLGAGGSAGYRKHLAPLWSVISPSPIYRYFPEQPTAAEHPAGLVQAILAALGLLAGCLQRAKAPGSLFRPTLILMGMAAALGLFLTTTPSLPVWVACEPLLSLLQYPWRFQALTALGMAFLAGALALLSDPGAWSMAPPVGWKHALMGWGGAGALVALLAVESLRALPYQSLALGGEEVTLQRMWAEERAAGQIGTTWTGEYLPVWVREQRWAIGRSWRDAGGPDLAEANAPRPPDAVHLLDATYAGLRLEVRSKGPATLVLHQFYYPGTVALLPDRKAPAYPYGTLGLATVDLPPGEHVLWVGRRPTLAQTVGSGASALGLACSAWFLWRAQRRRTLAAASSLLLLFAGLLLARHWTAPEPPLLATVQAEFEGRAALLASAVPRGPVRPGETAEVTLYWLARQGFAEDLVTFLHLVPEDNPFPLAQTDQQPDGGFTPTTRWVAGEIVPDRHLLHLPETLPPGRYALYAGLYQLQPFRNLEVISASVSVSSDRVLVGYLEVKAP
ncbi:MAG: 6-pyruvoyl-tetrahydropterin synthase-related protein [Anaerolineae bacterium]